MAKKRLKKNRDEDSDSSDHILNTDEEREQAELREKMEKEAAAQEKNRPRREAAKAARKAKQKKKADDAEEVRLQRQERRLAMDADREAAAKMNLSTAINDESSKTSSAKAEAEIAAKQNAEEEEPSGSKSTRDMHHGSSADPRRHEERKDWTFRPIRSPEFAGGHRVEYLEYVIRQHPKLKKKREEALAISAAAEKALRKLEKEALRLSNQTAEELAAAADEEGGIPDKTFHYGMRGLRALRGILTPRERENELPMLQEEGEKEPNTPPSPSDSEPSSDDSDIDSAKSSEPSPIPKRPKRDTVGNKEVADTSSRAPEAQRDSKPRSDAANARAAKQQSSLGRSVELVEDTQGATRLHIHTTVFIDGSKRKELKTLTRESVLAFRQMLETEKAQGRELTNVDAVAIITKTTQLSIRQRLRTATTISGSKRFEAGIENAWALMDPIELCNSLLQTFGDESGSRAQSTLFNAVQEIELPTAYADKREADAFMQRLQALADREGSTYTLHDKLTSTQMEQIIKRWLTKMKQQHADGARAASEDIQHRNPKTIEQFVDFLFDVTTEAATAIEVSKRFGAVILNQPRRRSNTPDRGRGSGNLKDYGTAHSDRSSRRADSRDRHSSRSDHRSSDRRRDDSRSRRSSGAHDSTRSSYGSDRVSAMTTRPGPKAKSHYESQQVECTACGKVGHTPSTCTFIASNHIDVNKDTTKRFKQSDAGLRWFRITGKPTLSASFDTSNYAQLKRPGGDGGRSSSRVNALEPPRSPSPARMSRSQRRAEDRHGRSRSRSQGQVSSRDSSPHSK
mmetsp:Transcript_12936/g.17630  ORF Transcript_12936/g.17630 Transcript_12936/m.17630 type:complete len:798 (-) Transcript_12936:97-2490(-)